MSLWTYCMKAFYVHVSKSYNIQCICSVFLEPSIVHFLSLGPELVLEMAFRYSPCMILSTCIVYLFLVPPLMDLPFLPHRSAQQLHFRSLSMCCVLSSVLYMCYLTVTLWEIPLSSFYSWGDWGSEIELKYFIQGLPAQRSNPPEMRHAGLREESMRYIQIFPYSEAFDSEIHTHLGVGKKGLVSCLSSSQRDFNVLWFELSLALGKKQSQAFESWRTVLRGVLRALPYWPPEMQFF